VGITSPLVAQAAVGLLPAQARDPDINSFQAGPFAFWTFVALALATVVLVRSMRRQFRRIDFDPTGTTDAERMRGAGGAPSARHEASRGRRVNGSRPGGRTPPASPGR
jgi:hypothetical protein